MADVILEDRVTTLEESLAYLSQVAARTSQEVAQLSREMREFKAEMAEFKDEMAEFKDEMGQSQTRIEANLEAYRAEWRAEARQMNRQWGELANKMGTLAEDLVAPSLPRILREMVTCPEGEAISMAVRVRRPHPIQRGWTQEFDVIAGCGEYMLFNETKVSLAPAHVEALIDKLEVVREYFPEYQAYKIIGAVASLYVDPSLVRYATRQGILVLAIGEELMDVMNEPGFEYRIF
jgi:uncharacterized coiled-coil protein SlyX